MGVSPSLYSEEVCFVLPASLNFPVSSTESVASLMNPLIRG